MMGLDGIWVMLEATVELGRGSAPKAKLFMCTVQSSISAGRESELILECESLKSCGITLIPTSTECFASLKRPRWSKTAIVPPSIRGL